MPFNFVSKLIIISSFFLILVSSLSADDLLKGIQPDAEKQYVIRLKNGDILTGSIVEFVSTKDEGEGIRFKTELGTATVYVSQILEIEQLETRYKHSHRVFLLPTAEPIGSNHFVGIFELMFLYGGVGIENLSLTAGRSMIPAVDSRDQLSVINVKYTVIEFPFEEMDGGMSVALGGNLAFPNAKNQLMHGYFVSTFRGKRSRITAAVYFKNGNQDFYTINLGRNSVDMSYEDGAFGIGLGLDTKISSRHDLSFIGELWNNNISRPTNTGVLLGFRLWNSSVSSDFGIAFFTQPYLVPFVSFTWTPF